MGLPLLDLHDEQHAVDSGEITAEIETLVCRKSCSRSSIAFLVLFLFFNNWLPSVEPNTAILIPFAMDSVDRIPRLA